MAGNVEQLMQGMTGETLPSGIRFIRLHYSADPLKDKAWAEEERSKEANPLNWEKQMEMRRVVTSGFPVFARYNDKIHCPIEGHNNFFPLTEGSIYLGGWDAGQTLNPAFVLLEVRLQPVRVRVLMETVSTGGESMDEFAPRVADDVEQIYPGLLKSVEHHADPTIETRNGSNKTTARQVARKYGFELLPSSNIWAKRQSAVAHILHLPGCFEVCGWGAPVLRRGFQGQYKYATSASGDTSGAGAVLLTPLKNAYSHVQDAFQYPSIKVFDQIKPGGGGWTEDDALLARLLNRQ